MGFFFIEKHLCVGKKPKMKIAAGSIILKYGQHHQVIATLKEFALHHNLKQNQKYTTPSSSFARHFKYKEHKDHYLVKIFSSRLQGFGTAERQ